MGPTPGETPARFPGYDVIEQSSSWDEATTRVVLNRLRTPSSVRFFSAPEVPVARALVDRLLAQDDEPRVPVFEIIDARLADRAGDGYRYVDLPEDPEAWRASVAYLDRDAMDRHGRGFAHLEWADQLVLVEDVRRTKGDWHGLPAKKMFSLWMRYACSAFYSHPWAWNEIGFGGPAYPRGYKNLGIGRREPWEVADHHPTDPVPSEQRTEGPSQPPSTVEISKEPPP